MSVFAQTVTNCKKHKEKFVGKFFKSGPKVYSRKLITYLSYDLQLVIIENIFGFP